MVWHNAHLESLKKEMPHIYDLAQVSKRVDIETNLLTKKLSDNVQAELLHNIHVYSKIVWIPHGKRVYFVDDGLEEMVEVKADLQEWVEMHVDFLDVCERQALYPFGGGAMSQRCDLSKVIWP
jgi:hypothetical protein